MEAIQVQEVSQAQAVAAFACLGPSLDPDGIATAQSVAGAGQCFHIRNGTGQATFSASIRGGALWVHGAAGQGSGMAVAGLKCLEDMARANCLQSVEFQTLRMGLVRVAQKRGYRVERRQGRGFVMAKAIK